MNKFSKTVILRRFNGAELIEIRMEVDHFVKLHLCKFKILCLGHLILLPPESRFWG